MARRRPKTGAAADRLAYALAKPSGANEAVVATVETPIAAARRLDDVAGPRVAARSALAWREIVRTLLEGGPSQVVQAQLRASAAELSQLLGCSAGDLARQRGRVPRRAATSSVLVGGHLAQPGPGSSPPSMSQWFSALGSRLTVRSTTQQVISTQPRA